MGKKNKKSKTVEVGTTVELNVADTSKKKNSKDMGKKSKKDAKGANVELIAAIANPSGKKAELHEILESNKLFAKSEKDLKEIKSVFSLRKQMLEYFDEEQVKEVKAALPKPERKAKPKVNPLEEEIKGAKKVKQLKAIAKENEPFNWKKLKKLEFEEMQTTMLWAFTDKAEPKAPTMIPNPFYAEIDAFEKKKKLKAWAKDHEEFASLKLKKLDLEDMKEALKGAVPEEIEKKKRTMQKKEGKSGVSQIDLIRSLVRDDKKPKKIVKALMEEFDQPETWANARFHRYERSFGKMGKNDAKLK